MRRLEFDLGKGDLLRQERRQQHAIIGKPRLFPDDCQGVPAERALGQLFDQTRCGHAVADDDERLTHPSSLKLAECASMRSAARSRRAGRLTIVVDGDVAQTISRSVPSAPGG